MSNPVMINDKAGWFSGTGESLDVVISSRIRLSRNLNGHKYPSKIDKAEEEIVAGKIKSAFKDISESDEFGISNIGDIQPLDRKILLERNLLSQESVLHSARTLIMSGDNLRCAVINDIDHLRISVIRPGQDIKGCAGKADEMDRGLEKKLDYAVSFEYGYLNSEVSNLGTGMRASVMMHLPALVHTNLIDKALKAVVQIGFTVKGFMGEDEHSLGSMYQISNQFTIGSTENEIIEKLENLSGQIAGYERKAREEMLSKKRTEVEDRVYRAHGLLTNCKLLSSSEAIGNLSALRMGINLGLIDLPVELCTGLIFLSQKSHIQKMIEDREAAADEHMIDYTRAGYVKKALLSGKL